jgi:hypothetical protein
MPYITNIVDLVNTSLASKLVDGSRFVKQLNGLSELIPRNEGEDQTTLPVLVSTNDYKTFDGLDDRYSIQIYHRVISVEQVESPLSFGDGATNGREEAKMRIVCFADRKRTKLDPYAMAFLLRSTLNEQFTNTQLIPFSGLLGAIVEATEDNYNGVEVWQNEYTLPSESYPVKLHQMLLSIDYTITTDYNTSCITSCLEC